MHALIQRVLQAAVDAEVDGETLRTGEINKGLLVFVGVTHTDTEQNAMKMADKIWTTSFMDCRCKT